MHLCQAGLCHLGLFLERHRKKDTKAGLRVLLTASLQVCGPCQQPMKGRGCRASVVERSPKCRKLGSGKD